MDVALGTIRCGCDCTELVAIRRPRVWRRQRRLPPNPQRAVPKRHMPQGPEIPVIACAWRARQSPSRARRCRHRVGTPRAAAGEDQRAERLAVSAIPPRDCRARPSQTRHADRDRLPAVPHHDSLLVPIRPRSLSGADDLRHVCRWGRHNSEDEPVGKPSVSDVREPRLGDRLTARYASSQGGLR